MVHENACAREVTNTIAWTVFRSPCDSTRVAGPNLSAIVCLPSEARSRKKSQRWDCIPKSSSRETSFVTPDSSNGSWCAVKAGRSFRRYAHRVLWLVSRSGHLKHSESMLSNSVRKAPKRYPEGRRRAARNPSVFRYCARDER